MPIDAKEEHGDLPYLEVRGTLSPADDAAVRKAGSVGEPRWRDDVYAFVAKPLRTIPTEYIGAATLARTRLDA